jgi:hypothetical protein
MKAYLTLFLAGALFALPALGAVPFDSGGNPWQRVTCYATDIKNISYTAQGFKRQEDWVRREAIRACQYRSERPSTCRLLRCRP